LTTATGLSARLIKETLNATIRQKEAQTKPTGAARRNEILVKQQTRMKNSDMIEQYHNQRIKLRAEKESRDRT